MQEQGRLTRPFPLQSCLNTTLVSRREENHCENTDPTPFFVDSNHACVVPSSPVAHPIPQAHTHAILHQLYGSILRTPASDRCNTLGEGARALATLPSPTAVNPEPHPFPCRALRAHFDAPCFTRASLTGHTACDSSDQSFREGSWL